MRLDNYVADIDAHAESDAPVFRVTDCKFLDAGLKLHSSPNRFDRARKLRQEPVAGVLHDAATVFRNRRADSVRQERCQFGVRSLFVIVHEPRIASHVGGQYRRQPAFDPALAALAPWPAIQPTRYSTTDRVTGPHGLCCLLAQNGPTGPT